MPRRLLGEPALALAGVLFFWYFATSTAEAPVGDAYEPFLGAIRLIRGRGLPESKVMPGQTFLLVPTAVVSKWIVDRFPDEGMRFPLLILAAAAFPAILTATTAALVTRAARALGHAPREALAAAIVFALATPAAVYAKSFFPQTAETLFLCACIWGLLAAHSRIGSDRAPADTAARAPLVLSGLAYGALLLVKAVGVCYLPALGAFVALMARDGRSVRRLTWWGAPAGALALLYLPYNFATHGSTLDFGYGLERDAYWGFSTNTLTGIYGLLLSPGKGLFFYAPILVLAIPGLARLYRRDRAAALLFAGVSLGPLLLFAHWWAWHGDNAWGPRYLVPIVPILTLAAAEMWRGARAWIRSPKSIALYALCVFSIGVQALGASLTNNAYQTLTYDTVIPQYRPEMGPAGPRDDELHLHWIPEFSPIVGHAWLVRHALRSDPASAYLGDYPWRALRPDGAWAPRIPDPPPPLDYWVLRLPRAYPRAAGTLRFVALASVLLLAASIVWLARASRRTERFEPNMGTRA